MVAGRELAAAVDNPVVTPDGRVESNGNFHGAPVAYVLDFLAIVAADLASMSERRTDRFLDVARNHGLHAVPRRRPGRGLRPHDRAVHPGRDRLRAEAARRARQRRLDPELGDAGGPRLDGLVRRAQAAPRRRRAHPGARHRAAHRRARPRAARAAASPPPPPARSSQALRRDDARARAPTATSPRRSRRPSSSSPPAPSSRRPSRSPARSADPPAPTTHPRTTRTGKETRHGRRSPRPRPARHHPHREVVADRGPAADADEQPRPRDRRASRRPRRLRRHRQGGPRLARRSTRWCAR